METSNESKALDGIAHDGLDLIPDEKWVPSSSSNAPPIVTVTEPSGSFCQMDSRFSVPLPPDDVYDIIIDPNNRRVFKNVKMRYDLAKQGMMKKFMGTWKIDPRYEADTELSSSNVSSSEEASSTSETSENTSKSRLTGSWVTLHQIVQPSFIPPWPLRSYMRGVCGQIIQDVCVDLQLEATRLAGLKTSSDVEKNSDMNEVD